MQPGEGDSPLIRLGPGYPQESERNLMRARQILRFVAALPSLFSSHQDYGTTDRVATRCRLRLTEPWLTAMAWA
jgi:hypothetical protein